MNTFFKKKLFKVCNSKLQQPEAGPVRAKLIRQEMTQGKRTVMKLQ